MQIEQIEPQVTPLRIYNPGDKDGEYLNLDSEFMLTLESFDEQTQVLHHAMAAPGFFLPRWGELTPQYRPDIRPLHRHAMIEVMYVISGEVMQYIEDDCRIYRTGECCILNKNVRHVESFSTDFEAVFFMLSDSYLRSLMEQDVHYRSYKDRRSYHSTVYRELLRLLEDARSFEKVYLDFRPLADPLSLSQEAEQLFTAMLQELRTQAHGHLNMVQGLMCRFLSLLAERSRYHMTRVTMDSEREDYLYNRICLYLRQSRGRLDYEELEQLMHYTRDYLNRIVKRRSGQTLGQLAQALCLEEAARALAQSDRSVSEIIHSLNYANRSYFYRIFHARYGMTPKAYRAAQRQARSGSAGDSKSPSGFP